MSEGQKTGAAVRALQGLFGILLMVGIWWLLTVPFSPPEGMGQRFAPGPALSALVSMLRLFSSMSRDCAQPVCSASR